MVDRCLHSPLNRNHWEKGAADGPLFWTNAREISSRSLFAQGTMI
jgi:hypothetical protein